MKSITLEQTRDALKAEVICGGDLLNQKISMVSACDLMSDVLTFTVPGALLLTGLTNSQVVRTAEMAEIAAICFVRDKKPPEDTITLAKEKGIPLLTTSLCMYESCGRLHEEGLSGGCGSR